MRPFLVENPLRVFEPRPPATESQFEEQVLRVAGALMPSYKAASWKPLIRDWHGHGAKPDLAMVSNDLESWYVIEVELASHSISAHIAPQLETLRNGVYDGTLLPHLQRSFPTANTESLARLVRREPGLLCIVDQYTDRIWRTCRDTGFELVVFEPYYGVLGGWAVLVERLPSELSRAVAPTTYSLSRGDQLGDSVAMMLPTAFPASYYKIRLPAVSEDKDRFVHVRRFESGPGVILPLSLIREHNSAWVEVIDPSHNLVQLVVAD